ncbi:MAG: 2-C-methyl-D-erythritol 4-phosphate cytidylyltransferase [Omnitrophica WOR_2 bacterium RIFOXYB2_FULL_38_16]|nr:MAG: 2-C-methyl-D-erythritol 4-phosphate cytidylyltransferase [Omnitrophica WOR_2 bacterium RIFOXYA2_FULL_38_17]OGX54575.1 MAG: 2-C-methyl-D-erythritol 4-phosphate cytidylyltransferase [Omnitrophica WOR_2 bacterium RIFOXYA12_FULL_38_10]OGX55637.1 MAG: 2-C-methyl-D-erythritol 4-phosphate cytidylyltransferase [Omnitrophica WOR_2 bacterium RIFOXYC2_FULL_38_12]OGX60081.1 MAG: 2-C-methyl-D-erythritol 4-phosphate cytidylyltransferase [Omnitrophica WOR_2 bacterium RIFOXYB2_FULL_38_16]
MKTQAILAIAGFGTRLKASEPKALLAVCGMPIFMYSLKVFENSGLIDSVVIVTQERFIDKFNEIIAEHGIKKVKKIVAGGDTRFESVNKGLHEIDDDTDIVLVHDGARPLITADLVDRSIELTKEYGAVIVAVEVKPTIKRAGDDLFVKETLNRNELWEVQTPQVFRKKILLKAHEQKRSGTPTDDASLVEQLGVKVKILKGDYRNIKVTTKEDIIVAEAFLNQTGNES